MTNIFWGYIYKQIVRVILHEARYDTTSLHVDRVQFEIEVTLSWTIFLTKQISDVTVSIADTQQYVVSSANLHWGLCH